MLSKQLSHYFAFIHIGRGDAIQGILIRSWRNRDVHVPRLLREVGAWVFCPPPMLFRDTAFIAFVI
jgi:hypothetical protein